MRKTLRGSRTSRLSTLGLLVQRTCLVPLAYMSCGRLQALFGGIDLLIVRSAGGITKAVPVLSVYLAKQQDVLGVLTAPVTAAHRAFGSWYFGYARWARGLCRRLVNVWLSSPQLQRSIVQSLLWPVSYFGDRGFDHLYKHFRN